MIDKISWQEFKDSGMLWWINIILHTFGLAIVLDMEDGEVKEAYPARVKYRGFGEKNNIEGYIKVSEYMNKTLAYYLRSQRSRLCLMKKI